MIDDREPYNEYGWDGHLYNFDHNFLEYFIDIVEIAKMINVGN